MGRRIYLCSKNKSADQLGGHGAADLSTFSYIYKKVGFSMIQQNIGLWLTYQINNPKSKVIKSFQKGKKECSDQQTWTCKRCNQASAGRKH